ncbi:MAG: alkaline phosphatase [Phycisphaerales bacterium]
MNLEPREHVPAGVSRRKVLASGAALAALAAAGGTGATLDRAGVHAPAAVTRSGSAAVRNLIFLVSDGMSAGTLSLTDHFLRHTTGTASHWTRLAATAAAHRSLVSTHAADSIVTDSAAASAAWSTGVKHNNGALCIGPDGRVLKPLLMRAKAQGKRVGVVTTTTVTHATPAGFYANCPSRDLQADIGRILVESPVDVALGGGSAFVQAELTAGNAGIRRVQTRAELLSLDAGSLAGKRLIGTFDADHLRMVLDRPATQPALEEMARVAIAALADGPDGFVLQIEAGRVDHAAHNNDACSLLAEQLEFDRTLALVAEFTLARSDTLLIATTDHGTANPGLTMYGKETFESLRRLGNGRRSFEWLFSQLKAAPAQGTSPDGSGATPPKLTPAAAAARLGVLVKEHLDIDLGPSRTAFLERAFRGEQADPFAERGIPAAVLGSLLASDLGVAFVSPHHTADHIEQLALGAAADTWPGFLDNTQVHAHLVRLLALPPVG